MLSSADFAMRLCKALFIPLSTLNNNRPGLTRRAHWRVHPIGLCGRAQLSPMDKGEWKIVGYFIAKSGGESAMTSKFNRLVEWKFWHFGGCKNGFFTAPYTRYCTSQNSSSHQIGKFLQLSTVKIIVFNYLHNYYKSPKAETFRLENGDL